MNQLLKRAWYWKLAFGYGLFFSLNSIFVACIAAFTGVDWNQLSSTQHFVIVCAVGANWTGTMMALFNRTMHRLSENNPFENGKEVKV